MATTSTIFDGFIKLVDNIYMKPCEAHPSAYDLYVHKPSTSARHPEGKMDDVAFGLSLELAISWHVIRQRVSVKLKTCRDC